MRTNEYFKIFQTGGNTMNKIILIGITMLALIGIASATAQPTCGSTQYLGDYTFWQPTQYTSAGCAKTTMLMASQGKYGNKFYLDKTEWLNAFHNYAKTHTSISGNANPIPTKPKKIRNNSNTDIRHPIASPWRD